MVIVTVLESEPAAGHRLAQTPGVTSARRGMARDFDATITLDDHYLEAAGMSGSEAEVVEAVRGEAYPPELPMSISVARFSGGTRISTDWSLAIS